MKKFFKNKVMPALALGAVMLTAVSCGEQPSPSDESGREIKATITWWNNYKQPTNPGDIDKPDFKEYKFVSEVIKEFNKIYPNIEVKVENKGSYNDIQKAVSSGLSTGSIPNIATCYPDHVATYKESGAVLAMDDFMNNEKIGLGKTYDVSTGAVIDDPKTSKTDLNQSYFNAEKNMYAEKQYLSLPYSKSAETLAVNYSVFEKDGAGKCGNDTEKNGKPVYTAPVAAETKKPYKIPTDYKELISTARQMKKDFPSVFENQRDSRGFFTAVPFCYDSTENMFISFCKMAGIPYTDANGKELEQQVLFNNPDAREMLIQLKKWNNEGLIATQNQLKITDEAKGYHAYSSDMMKEGKIFMSLSSTAGARYFAEDGGFVTKLVKTPTFTKECYDGKTGAIDNSKHKVISQGPSLTFFKKTDQAQNEASWLFYKFLTNSDNSANLAQMTSYFPLRESSYQDEKISSLVSAADREIKSTDNYKTKNETYTGTVLNLNKEYTKNNEYFSSPVFKKSSSSRTAVGNLVNAIFDDKEAKTDEQIEALVDKELKAAYQQAVTK